MPEIKFGNKFNTTLYKTEREISLLVPRYFFDDREEDLDKKIKNLQNEDIFELIAGNFKAIVKNFDLFNLNRKKELVKLFENSAFEAEILKKIKGLKKGDPERRFKEFLVALNKKSPEEIVKTIDKISASESSNKNIKALNEKMKQSGLSLKDQLKLVENFDMVSALAPRIKNLKKSLKDFKKLINSLKKQKSKDEARIHWFLIENYWLLGVEYYSKPKYSAINKLGERTDKQVLQEDRSKPDIIVESIDGSKTAVFFELEEVKDKIKHKKGKKETGLLAADAIEAINQAVRYTIQAKLKGKHPIGKVIVGSAGKSKKWKEKLATVSEYFGNIEVLTYDDLIERAQNTIDFFENYEKEKEGAM